MKMNKIIGVSLLAASVATSFQATAASTDLTITGEISHGICSISIDNNGAYDYGDIDNSKLIAGSTSPLEQKSHTMSIACPAPTLIAFGFIDNREGTSMSSSDTAFGLGLDTSDNNIGDMTIRLNDGSSTDDTGPLTSRLGYTYDGGSNWTYATGGTYTIYKHTSRIYSPFIQGGTEPHPIITYSNQVRITPTLNKRENLNTSTEFNLDGSVTIELIYI
jgi:type 1 fimbria pilin